MPKHTPTKPPRPNYKISGLRLRIPHSKPMGMKRERYARLMLSSRRVGSGSQDEKLKLEPKETK